jgi:hypothetical protein
MLCILYDSSRKVPFGIASVQCPRGTKISILGFPQGTYHYTTGVGNSYTTGCAQMSYKEAIASRRKLALMQNFLHIQIPIDIILCVYIYIHTHIHTYTHISTYIYLFL